MAEVLLITTKYKHENGSPWLVSELAEEMVAQGSRVTVLNLSWTGLSVLESDELQGLRVINFSAVRPTRGSGGLLGKWGFSSFKLMPFLLKEFVLRNKYDLLVSFSPCTALWAAIVFAKMICRKSSLIYWDIFPLHNQAIGKSIPKKLLPVLKGMEKRLIFSFDLIGCMGNGNRNVFLNYFGGDVKAVKIVPVWTSLLNPPLVAKNEIKNRHGFREEFLMFVFGGQLVAGRGIESLCEAFFQVAAEVKGIVLTFCGAGPLEDIIRGYEERSFGAIRLIGSLPRGEYMNFLVASDVGVVSAISSSGTSSFPSKSLDYMACNLPIFAILEPENDLSLLAVEHDFGVVCTADKSTEIALSIKRMIGKKSEFSRMGLNGNSYLKSRHSVSNVVDEFMRMSNV